MVKLPHALFISDLHLCRTRPQITQTFIHTMLRIAARAEKLFILGDFFEYWAGDDDLTHADHAELIDALHTLTSNGTQLFIMHGNRDFLLGETFMHRIGATWLDDPSVMCLYGYNLLLSHGDVLCTDDVQYQTFRTQVRNKSWQTEFLTQPLSHRKQLIEGLRQQSEQAKSEKPAAIMDVNAEAVSALLRAYHYPDILIHGHTHRPDSHRLTVDDHPVQRIVLGDWYEHGSYLQLDNHGCTVHRL